MIQRILAIVSIYICTTAAWVILGSAITAHTVEPQPELHDKVASTWGTPQVQKQPSFLLTPDTPLSVENSQIDADLNLDYRQKGLLWYSTYKVVFAGTYAVHNDAAEDRSVTIHWPFPAEKALLDDVSITLDGKPLAYLNQNGGADAHAILPAGATGLFRLSYSSWGLDSWTYSLGTNVAQVRNFSLRLNTNFRDIDFPENGLSPTVRSETKDGLRLSWNYRNLVSGYQIAITLPARLQPGPLAGQISYFAPVSLFFFFFVMLLITTLRRIELHPVNYFFLAAAFFAFHLLLAYLVDHISVHAAFVIASVVSTGLVVSHLRLVVGMKFAMREAGLAQFVYLILFSYAFFFRGFTGLAITIGSIATLFVAMQVTGRIRWSEHFGSVSGRYTSDLPSPSTLVRPSTPTV
jgi:hypothetical protein